MLAALCPAHSFSHAATGTVNEVQKNHHRLKCFHLQSKHSLFQINASAD